MSYAAVILFLIYSLGLGFTVTSFLKESKNFFERNLTRLGIGLSLIPVLGILLSILHIPVDWKLFLFLSLVYPAFCIFKNYKSFNLRFKLKKSDIVMLVVLIIFLATFYMYHRGAFAYPYLEDDDSWSHAIGVKYVSIEKTFFNPNGGIHYLDPYPPSYDGLLGILNQASSSVMWTLKFFNALIISFSIIFFYLFMKTFTNNRKLALISTIFLAMVPSYLSHFIWAHSFIPGFIFLAFLSLENIKYDKKWMYPASIVISSIILTSLTQGIKFILLFLVYFAVKCVLERRFLKETFTAGILGSIITLLWWAPLTVRYKGVLGLLDSLGFPLSQFGFSLNFLNTPYFYFGLIGLAMLIMFRYIFTKSRLADKQKNLIGILFAVAVLFSYIGAYSFINVWGTADRIYDFNDFFIAKKTNMINNPIGIGIVIFSLFLISLLLILYEQFFIICQKKSEVSKFQLNALYILLVINAVSLFVSIVSFSMFRLKSGTILKKFALDSANLNYFLSFSFNVWGVYLFIASLLLLAFISAYLIFKGYTSKEKIWLPISLIWLTYIFAGLHNIPTSLFVFRFWMLFAFVVSIIAAYGFIILLKLIKIRGIPELVLWVVLIILIFFTSGIQKYTVNTAQWPPGAFWTSFDEISGYVWLRENLPPNTNVFTFVNNGPVIGMDMYTCHWCSDIRNFQRTGFNESASDINSFLKSRGYKYLIIEGQFAKKYGANETNSKIKDIMSSGLFKVVHQTNGFLLFELL